jgi:hypothetical protein
MRKMILALGAALALAGCCTPTTEAEQAEREFNLVVRYGTAEDKCVAAKKVEDAWLKRTEAVKYRFWAASRRVYCFDLSPYGD